MDSVSLFDDAALLSELGGEDFHAFFEGDGLLREVPVSNDVVLLDAGACKRPGLLAGLGGVLVSKLAGLL